MENMMRVKWIADTLVPRYFAGRVDITFLASAGGAAVISDREVIQGTFLPIAE